jgi:hypothetical protein
MAKRTTKKPQRDVHPTFTGLERSDLLKRAEVSDDMPEEDIEILTEAYERFEYCSTWESKFRDLYVQDVKFANADSDNGWQWPDDLRRDRMLNRRPALTINKVQNHVNLVVNDGRQNKAAIEIKPAGKESSFQAAQGIEALIRNIEYQSYAQSIYDEMSQSQVEGGIGYGRIISLYPDPRSFNQELRVAPVQNHLNVFIDPDIKQKNGSDARFGFIFEDVTREEYIREYDDQPPVESAPFGIGMGADWVKPDHVRVAEYYRIDYVQDELIYYKHGQHEEIFLRSEVPVGIRQQLRDAEAEHKAGNATPDIEIITRETTIKKLQWYKIGAHRVIDRREYPTQYVPIFRFVGRERVIDNKLERKGLVRTLKDAQRMYNYNSSAEAEAAAIATKTNWLAALESIAGNENAWNKSNVENKAVLTYRHKDRDGDAIPPPQRIDPAKSAEAYLAGMEIASRELEMASGQGPAQFGKPTKEKSGRAIAESQRQGDILTYDFIDNQALGIAYAGMILLDWIPHCYKTKQVVQILDKDGTERMLTIDPKADLPYEEKKVQDQVQAVLNPRIGQYKVQAQAGPAYATQRQEAWNAFVQIITGAPDLINEIGDLMFLSADFPMADEIAQRIRRKIKQLAPWLLDDNAVNPQVQQLQQQLQQAGQQIAEILQQLAEKDRKLRDQTEDIRIKQAGVVDKFRRTDLEAYGKHTDRISAVTNAQLDLDRAGDDTDLKELIRSILKDVMTEDKPTDKEAAPISVEPDRSANDQEGDFLEPRQAPDGHHYIRKGGQHYKVDVGAMNGAGISGQPTG